MTSQFQLDEGPPTYRELFGDQLIRNGSTLLTWPNPTLTISQWPTLHSVEANSNLHVNASGWSTNESNDSECHVNFIQLADDNSVCEYSRRCSRGGPNAQKRCSTNDSVRVKKKLLYIIGFWLILVLIALGLFVFANRNNLL